MYINELHIPLKRLKKTPEFFQLRRFDPGTIIVGRDYLLLRGQYEVQVLRALVGERVALEGALAGVAAEAGD